MKRWGSLVRAAGCLLAGLGLALALVLVPGVVVSGGTGAVTSAGGTLAGAARPAPDAQPQAVPAEPSSGCHAAAVAPIGISTDVLTVNRVSGTYYLQVPSSYTGRTAMPVVMDFHGYEEPASVQVTLSQLGTLGESQGFITVTPEIDHQVPYWDTTIGGPDMTWVGGLMDHLEQTLCADQRRLYATGYSNGAFLSSAIACQYAGRVAAVAPVAGIETSPECHPTRPVPVVAFHGTGDRDVSFTGGIGPAMKGVLTPSAARAMGSFLPRSLRAGGKSIPGNTAAWARRNGCANRPVIVGVADGVTLWRYRCPHNATVELYVVRGGGHTWPGSKFAAELGSITGMTTTTINATQLMWQFFRTHPLTRQS